MAKDNYHDKGYKELLAKKRNFLKFLRHFVKGKWVELIDESNLRLCDKGFVDAFFKELESDLIYSAEIKGHNVYFYIITELQSTVDFKMPFRVFMYISAIFWREWNNAPEKERNRVDFRLPLVIPIVFYNGEEKWTATRSFKDYLKCGDMFEGVIDFQYTLVDINLLDRKYLLENHDAICAVIAVDKVKGGDPGQLYDTITAIRQARQKFDPDEFKDVSTWLKRIIARCTNSEEEAEKFIKIFESGDDIMERTGIDIFFDEAEARGVVKSAALMLQRGMDIREIADILGLSDEQIEQVESKAGLKKEIA